MLCPTVFLSWVNGQGVGWCGGSASSLDLEPNIDPDRTLLNVASCCGKLRFTAGLHVPQTDDENVFQEAKRKAGAGLGPKFARRVASNWSLTWRNDIHRHINRHRIGRRGRSTDFWEAMVKKILRILKEVDKASVFFSTLMLCIAMEGPSFVDEFYHKVVGLHC